MFRWETVSLGKVETISFHKRRSPNDVRASQGSDSPVKRMRHDEKLDDGFSPPGRGVASSAKREEQRDQRNTVYVLVVGVVRGNATAKKPFSFTMSACGEHARKRGGVERRKNEPTTVEFTSDFQP